MSGITIMSTISSHHPITRITITTLLVLLLLLLLTRAAGRGSTSTCGGRWTGGRVGVVC
jgi:hypothetical protein